MRASTTVDEVREAYERLHDAHAIVLDAESRDVWMAHPFSAVPTEYRVEIGERSWFANCVWDALGSARCSTATEQW